jgi:hypothetical protein
MRAESACLLGCRTAPLLWCQSCAGAVRGVVYRLSPVLFYWKPHHHCTLLKPDTTCSWARNNTYTRGCIILLSPHSSRTCYPQPLAPLTAVRLSQHVYSSKCEMHLAYRQYVFGVIILPSYQEPMAATISRSDRPRQLAPCSRLCKDTGLALCTVEIMRDIHSNSTRPADRLVGPHG